MILRIVELLHFHCFPTDAQPIATTTVPLDVLAQRAGAVPVSFEFAGGQGRERGFGVRLSAGLVVMLGDETFVNLRTNRVFHTSDPALYVDAGDVASRGVEDLLAEILPALQLSRSDLAWVVDASVREHAAELVARLRGHRARGVASGSRDPSSASNSGKSGSGT